MVINVIALSSPGGVQRGQAPSDGGLGVSPRFSKTPLGRAGGKNNAYVAATTPTLPIAHSVSRRYAPTERRPRRGNRSGELGERAVTVESSSSFR